MPRVSGPVTGTRSLVSGLLASCVLLVGCGDPNAGTAASAEFEVWWPDHRVEGFEAEASGNNLIPYSGELIVTVTAARTVGVADIEEVRDVVCSFDPEASASLKLAVVLPVVEVRVPCGSSGLDLGAVLELEGFLTDLDAESAALGYLGSPRLDVVLRDSTGPAVARRVARQLVDYLPTVPGVFVDLQGNPSLATPDAPIDVSVQFGSQVVRSADLTAPGAAGPGSS